MFTANAAWLSCAGIAHNLLHAAAALASRYHATARSGTLRRHLIGVPARIAHRGRDQIILHLPEHWPWYDAWEGMFNARPTAHHRPAWPDPGTRADPHHPTTHAATSRHRPITANRTCRRTVSGR